MKKLYFSSITLFVILMLSSSAFPQIPNNSFEGWPPGWLDPTDWWTSDTPTLDAVTMTLDASEGVRAVMMQVIDDGNGSGHPPFMSAGYNGQGFPVSQRHGSIRGYYKFFPLGIDVLDVRILMYLGNDYIGLGVSTITTGSSTYTEFNAPINYTTGDTPDWAFIYTTVYDLNSGLGTIGSWALVDNLTLGGVTDVEQISGLPENFSLQQNYPNPFNPSTLIEYSIPEQSFVDLKVYDILGNEVATLVNEEQSAGTYRADFTSDNLASGLYVAQLRAVSFSKTIKMSLMK